MLTRDYNAIVHSYKALNVYIFLQNICKHRFRVMDRDRVISCK